MNGKKDKTISLSALVQQSAAQNDLCKINPKQKPFYYHKKFDQFTKTTVNEKGRILKITPEEYKPWMQ